jgi:hypothetical protein
LRSDPLRVRVHSLRRTLGDWRLRVVLVSAVVLALGVGTARAQAPTPDPAPVPPPPPPPYVPPPSEPVQTSSTQTSSTAQTSVNPAQGAKAKKPSKRRHREPRPPSFQRNHPSFAITAPGADMRSGSQTPVLSQETLGVARVRGRAALMIGLAALALLFAAMALLPRSVFYGLAARTRTRLSFLGL